MIYYHNILLFVNKILRYIVVNDFVQNPIGGGRTPTPEVKRDTGYKPSIVGGGGG